MTDPRLVLPSFLARFREVADVVFVIHDSTTHRQASAWYTTDDNSRPTVSFTYGGVVRQHGRCASFLGSCTIPVTVPCRLSRRWPRCTNSVMRRVTSTTGK
jgi:hypothetical protein